MDDDDPIPPIPSYAYPKLRPVPDIPRIATNTAGKRKATSARQEIERDSRGKKQRKEDAVESDGTEESDEEGEDEDPGEGEGEKDELVDEGAGEQSEKDSVQRTVKGKGKQKATTANIPDDGMDVDEHLDDSHPAPATSVRRPVVEITTQPGKAKKTKSKAPKSRRMILDESDDEPARLHAVPQALTPSSTHPIFQTTGLSDTQLELSWRSQTKNTDLGHKIPTVSSTQCVNCERDHVICWTVTGSTACLNCRYVKKSRCPNVGPPTKKKDHAKSEGAQRTSGKRVTGKSTRSEEAASSSKLKITVPPSAVLQPPDTSAKSAAIPLPAAAPLRPLAASRSEDPTTSRPDTVTVTKRRSRSASRAATTKAPMAHPPNAPATASIGPAAPATIVAPATLPATEPDPLICLPPAQEEPRCTYSVGFMYSILIMYNRYPCFVRNGASYHR